MFMRGTGQSKHHSSMLMSDLLSTPQAAKSSLTCLQIPELEDATSNAGITPQYVRAKQLICCTLTNILHQVWIALTICGASCSTSWLAAHRAACAPSQQGLQLLSHHTVFATLHLVHRRS